jgi:GNAT superfamily N-acetyltransferase
VPRLWQVARDRGWWDPLAPGSGTAATAGAATAGVGRPAMIGVVDAATWERLVLASRVVPPSDSLAGHALVLAAIHEGASVSAAVEGTLVVGVALAGPTDQHARREVLALGVAPPFRRQGLAGALLKASVTAGRPGDIDHVAEITVAERDPIEPLERSLRASIAERLFERAGFEIHAIDSEVRRADPSAIRAVRWTIRGIDR